MFYFEAIRDALDVALAADDNVITYGLGTNDPKGIFGTTLGLSDKYGTERVFDMPTSENAMTGIGIGAALYNLRPVICHQRLDFALLSLDQIINNAAKWRFMFGGARGVPITIRMIIGRGWGQGPTHSQNLQALFAHIPGLKVVMPSTPADAKGLLLTSIFDEDPVIFLEHRWLHNQKGDVPFGDYRVPMGKSNTIFEGNDITIVSMSYLTIEAIHAVKGLDKIGISCELIDLRSIRPLDIDSIKNSVMKTCNLLILDTGNFSGSISGEIAAQITTLCWNKLNSPPARLTSPDFPEATSPALTKDYHVTAKNIYDSVLDVLNIKSVAPNPFNKNLTHHDVPGDWFTGPF